MVPEGDARMATKTVAFIPTRERAYALELAKQVAPLVDKLYVLGKNVKFNVDKLPDEVQYIEREPYNGIADARNMAVGIAVKEHADYVLMLDDDVRFNDELISFLKFGIEKFPCIGAVASSSRVMYHWAESVEPNIPFRMDGMASQFVLYRLEALLDIAERSGKPPFGRVNTMEDLYSSVLMWEHGWAILKTHSPDMFHNVIVARTSKSESMGGQPIAERDELMPYAVEQLQPHKGPGKVLQWITLKWNRDKQQYRHHLRYNYDVMCENVINRWGIQGYSDNKGRHW